MNINSRSGPRAVPERSERFHLWRGYKDSAARGAIALGGFMVIAAVLMILFYLAYVVAPLFLPAEVNRLSLQENPAWSGESTVYLSVEEQQQVGLHVGRDGVAEFFRLEDLHVLKSRQLTPGSSEVVMAVGDLANKGLVAVAYADGRISLFRHLYETDFSRGVAQRSIVPSIEFPYGEELRLLMPGGGITGLALSDGNSELVVAVAGRGGRVRVEWSDKQENFLTSETTLNNTTRILDVEFEVTAIALSNDHRWLYLGDAAGNVHFVKINGMQELQTISVTDRAITNMTMLLGGISVLVGDAGGSITQLFPVRDTDNQYSIEVIRVFDDQHDAIVHIVPEQRRKGFIAVDAGGNLSIYHSTAQRLVHQRQLSAGTPVALALAPRASGMLLLYANGQVEFMDIDNEHPEVSFASLWSKVWYENYQQAEHVWQSSSSSNDFEPKFSLTPLAFGTLKAAFYAMLFALPLALMGAAFTAYFMSPGLRRLVKPTIEIMAALPTVILGFLAGLWFAPYLEENLVAIFTLLLVMPFGLLVFAWFWSNMEGQLKDRIPEGWEPVLLLPVLVIIGWLAIEVASPLQNLLFGGDLRIWLSQEAGISYDQRNAMVVGVAMGFAVIPTIFSIAEDAIYGVPKSLSDGSLALGATPWQTLALVVLPTASPGMFSAVMIGLGRAVGETMIVLMATGNTPVMDWNLFEGMRTLAANIAVEMPESELHSSHYRILFLAALVLFLFTFIVNTAAELIRQRLREKYSSL